MSVSLTDRERDVYRRLAKGDTDVEIAEALGVSRPTVRKNIQAAMERNGESSRLRLAVRIEREKVTKA